MEETPKENSRAICFGLSLRPNSIPQALSGTLLRHFSPQTGVLRVAVRIRAETGFVLSGIQSGERGTAVIPTQSPYRIQIFLRSQKSFPNMRRPGQGHNMSQNDSSVWLPFRSVKHLQVPGDEALQIFKPPKKSLAYIRQNSAPRRSPHQTCSKPKSRNSGSELIPDTILLQGAVSPGCGLHPPHHAPLSTLWVAGSEDQKHLSQSANCHQPSDLQ